MTHSAALGVAVIGYEFMGRAHSHAWRTVRSAFGDLPSVQLRVLAGRDSRGVERAAKRLGWDEWTSDWRTILDRDDIDIVDICAPGLAHAEMATAALAAGKHVLVEKPLANTVLQAQEMVLAARQATDQVSMIGFNYRRVPALALARDLIADGRIGTVRQVRMCYLQDWLADANAPMSWRLRQESAGSGVLGDLGSHAVDQVRFLLNQEIVSVTGSLRTFVAERPGDKGLEQVTVDDAAWATLQTSGDAVVSLEASRMTTGRKNSLHIEVYGSSGAIAFDLEALNVLRVADSTDQTRPGFADILVTEPTHPYLSAWWPPGHVLGWEHTFVHQAAAFLAALDGREPVSPTFTDGLRVQQVLDAVAASAGQSSSTVAVATDLSV